MVARSWSTGKTWSSPTSPALGPSHRAPSSSLGPLLTATPFQRWAGVQPQVENSPTVAAEPGENLPSQNRPRKDVFPTEELPTNTILSFIHEIVKKEKEICASFAVVFQTEKVIAIVND